MNTPRFVFPNFTVIKSYDTANHENEIGKLRLGDDVFTIHLFRRIGLHKKAHFLVSKIFDRTERVFLWEFPEAFEGIGVLAQADNEPVVALIEDGPERKVNSIVPLSTFTATKPMSLQRKIELKRLAAKSLGYDYALSDNEKTIAQLDFRKQQSRLQEEAAAENHARDQRKKERLERLERRQSITAHTHKGGTRFGIPVVGDEWHSLHNGTNVIRVESYNDETGEHGPVIEAFRVVKEGGGVPRKDFPTEVLQERPRPVGFNIPRPLGAILVELSDGTHEALVYGTMDQIRTAQGCGLNHGTYVTSSDTKSSDQYEIYSVHADKIKKVGLFKPVVA